MKPATSTLILLNLFAAAGSIIAQESIESIEELDSSSVVGNAERLFKLAGSAAYLDQSSIRTQNYTNINRIVARVPGVFARDETGTGFFPNLSIRGADGVRMERTTVMEDGILMAPAPYAAPSAYYSPKAGRMSAIEILKGSSQVKYGPHTTGGVINYLSTQIPEEETFYARFTYGSDNAIKAHTYYGDTIKTSNGDFGYLLEMFYQGSEGFRDTQSTAAVPNPRNNSHTLIEPMLKLSWSPDTAMQQKLEFKYGYSELDANESYLGQTDQDALNFPDRRYAGSQFDNIFTEHHRTSLKYNFKPSEALSLEAIAYYNEFSRNWYKLNKVSENSGDRTSLHSVLGDPTGAYANQFAILNGTRAGFLDVKANSRAYKSYGIQFSGQYQFETSNLEHTLSFGTRLHRDKIRRYQWADEYAVNANGGVTSVAYGQQGQYRGPDKEGNRLQEAKAISAWIEDEIKFNKLTIKPGIRYEHVDLHHSDYASSSTYDGSLDYFAPGIGFTYEMNDASVIYGGAYKGYSTPGPRAHLRSGVDLEESMGYELGIRHKTERLNSELALFYTDYTNMVGSEAGRGDTGASARNAGSATVYGLEANISYDLLNNNSGMRIPVYATATLTSATIDNALTDSGEGDIYSGGAAGARIPYIPEFQASFGIGVETEKWGANLDASYLGKSFGTALEGSAAAGSSSRNGEVGDGFIIDLSGYYTINDNVKIISGVSNIFDDRYISSRLPEGARANAGRSLYTGFEIKF